MSQLQSNYPAERRDICRKCECAIKNPSKLFRPHHGLTSTSICLLDNGNIASMTACPYIGCADGRWPQLMDWPQYDWCELTHPDEKAVVTGCDMKHEQFVPFWFHNYEAHNHYPVYFIDFGLSESMRKWVSERATILEVDASLHPYCKKGPPLLQIPYKQILWIDTDTEIHQNLYEAFTNDKLMLRYDSDFARKGVRADMVQAGVFSFCHGDPIIRDYARGCGIGETLADGIGDPTMVRDQIILSWLVTRSKDGVRPLDHRFNWMTFEDPVDNLAITHFAGKSGKVALQNRAITVRAESKGRELPKVEWCAMTHPGKLALVTGCDANMEWMLPFWWRNYAKHNAQLPVYFADFGMTPSALAWCRQHGVVIEGLQAKYGMINPMYLKPMAVMSVPYQVIIWMDLDTEIFGSLLPMADGDFQLKVRHDAPMTMTALDQSYHVQAGVQVVKHGCDIYTEYAGWCALGEASKAFIPDPFDIRDQQILSHVLDKHNYRYSYLDHRYNWLIFEGELKMGIDGKTDQPTKPVVVHHAAAVNKEHWIWRLMHETHITIVVPTIGRYALIRTLLSINQFVEFGGKADVILIEDGDGWRAGWILELIRSQLKYPIRHIKQDPPEHNYANRLRQRAMQEAQGDYILFMDDDDVYAESASVNIRRAIVMNYGKMIMHQMQLPFGWLTPETGKHEIAPNNVSTQCVAVPNVKSQLGTWGDRYQGDYDFIASCKFEPVFVDTVVCLKDIDQRDDQYIAGTSQRRWIDGAPRRMGTDQDYQTLQQQLERVGKRLGKDAIYVELGSYMGGSTRAGLINCSLYGGKYYAVDIWTWLADGHAAPDGTWIEEGREHRSIFDAFTRNMLDIGYNWIQYLHPLRMDSVKAAAVFDNASVDLLFIDSNHTYDHITRELRAWMPKMKRDGIVCGHDYYFAGIKKAVDEIFGPDVQLGGSVWYVDLNQYYTRKRGESLAGLRARTKG